MKPFATYQYLEGTEMTDRDKKEIGSKFWNRGKWDNFVAPLLPKSAPKQTIVDMGCNAGLFLLFAQEHGFERIVGVDSDAAAVKRGEEWRDKQGYGYQFIRKRMEEVIDDLPIADYTILANAHYYFTINDWIDYLDKLQHKTHFCIIVTAEKRHINRCWASADVADIQGYFSFWKQVGFIDELPLEGDPMPRRLWAMSFESPYIRKTPAEWLDSSNHVQDDFYRELDEGKDYKQTRYYRILVKYRAHWGERRLNRWIEERIKVYQSLKAEGLKKPILIDKQRRILDGNHRYSMLRTLGYDKVFVRTV